VSLRDVTGFNTFVSIGTAAKTKENSQTSTAGGIPATEGMSEIVEVPTTVLASVGSPTVTSKFKFPHFLDRQISLSPIAIGLLEVQCC
jgi:hypothetical protein